MACLLQLLMATVLLLAMKPFSLFISVCVFSLKTTFIVIQTWMELVIAAVFFHMNMFWKAFTWMSSLISLPKQVVTALQRERLLELNIKEMQFEMESLLWHMKKLENHLQKVIKECNFMKIMLVELEEEYESAICKVEQLQHELEDARNQNLQIKQIQGKAIWRFRADDFTGIGGPADKDNSSSRTAPSKSSYEVGGTSTEAIYPSMPVVLRKDVYVNEMLSRQRGIAISQSLFSATLSLFVAMIIWAAEAPCVPLVLALFTVVGMSLGSAFRVFSVVGNKPASEALALVSFNMFLLGILSYPTFSRFVLVWLHQ